MSGISMKDLKEMQIRLDQEKAAKRLLDKEFRKYVSYTFGPHKSKEEWERDLLVHFVVKSIESDNSKGANI